MAPNRQAQTSVLRGRAGGNIAGGAWEQCILTWYDPALGGTNSSSGRPDPHSATASGEPYDPNKYTCAAPPAYPFGTMLTFRFGNTQISCRVNDRGGAIQGNHFDLSRAAANALGILGAGRVTASFVVGGSSGAPPAAQPSQSTQSAGSGGPGGDPLTILSDILTLNISDLAQNLAIAGVTVVKDLGLGFVDWVVIPWWHWNQRAAQYYLSNELFTTDESKWTVMPWTAAFWGLGYWLFWTDPDSSSLLKPAPIRRSRIARHVRSLQAVPARRSLVKPKDVRSRTLKKPEPVVSKAVVKQTGTIQVTRNVPVQISDTRTDNNPADRNVRSQARIERAGTVSTEPRGSNRNGRNETPPATPSEPDTFNRSGNPTLPHSGRVTNGGTGKGSGSGNRPRRR